MFGLILAVVYVAFKMIFDHASLMSVWPGATEFLYWWYIVWAIPAVIILVLSALGITAASGIAAGRAGKLIGVGAAGAVGIGWLLIFALTAVRMGLWIGGAYFLQRGLELNGGQLVWNNQNLVIGGGHAPHRGLDPLQVVGFEQLLFRVEPFVSPTPLVLRHTSSFVDAPSRLLWDGVLHHGRLSSILAAMKRIHVLGALGLFFVLGCLLVGWSIAPVLHAVEPIASTKILARDGSLLYEVVGPAEGLRTPVVYATLPQNVIHAVVSTEDARFFQHYGVDWWAVFRVLRQMVFHQPVIGGASTLEQQVIKNLYFSNKSRTVVQKIREMIAARYWSTTHTKEQTLELYLNTIYFGNQAYGIQAAARLYFHKDVADLNLAESALLAGMIASPATHDPYLHPAASAKRQQFVLDGMVTHRVLDAVQRDQVSQIDVVTFPPTHRIRAPHFVFHVLDELELRYPNIRSGGYVVTTTLDPDLQRTTQDIIFRRLDKLREQHVTDAAVVAMDPRTGEIGAYVGSADYFNTRIQGQVDMVTAQRQPGSALKPFMYFAALLDGFTPASVIADLPIRFETATGDSYYPRNYNYRYYGPITLRDALGSSLNIPAVKVLHEIGLQRFFEILQHFGVSFPKSPDYYGLGVVLGGGEVTLLKVMQAYADLARGAMTLPMNDVREVKDGHGQILYTAPRVAPIPIFEDVQKTQQASALISDILSDPNARVRAFGESNFMNVGKRIAAKTGTTRDFRDNWAFGYTPDFVLGVWVGNADNTPMKGVSGVSGAMPIWHDVMQTRFQDVRDIVWPTPLGMIEKDICLPSGLLTTPYCSKTRREKFISGTEPTKTDDWYFLCPQHGGSIFLKLPAEYMAWSRSAKYELHTAEDCDPRTTTTSEPVIISPLDGDVFQKDEHVASQDQLIPFTVGGGRSGQVYRWHLNDQLIETTDVTFAWNPVPGIYTLSLDGAKDVVHFRVE